jgi:hypothetical protein
MSDEEKEVFSGSVTSQPQMVNVQTSGPMYIVERSSAPQVIGILVIVYYILTTLMSLFSWLSLDFISDIDETGTVEALPTVLLLGVIFLSLIPAAIGIFGGFRIFQYKKQGIWITLGAIVTAWLISIVNSALTSDYSGGTGDAGLDAMFQGVCGIFCVAICGIIVCIPLFMANSGLE